MVGIICALEYEAELLITALENRQEKYISKIKFNQGQLNGRDVVIAVCGVGKVFAAICAQTMILGFSPELIINTGVAGAIHSMLNCGDIAVATSVVQHDMDTSPLGDPVGLVSGINVINFECCKPASQSIAKTAKFLGLNTIQGTVASGDQFVASAEKKKYLKDTFNAIACDMEAGAIGQTCFVNGIKFCIIRAISDSADGLASLDYPTFSKQAANNAAKIIITLL